ncbi:uncharacterized protein LOC141904570 [Tubulanus polymorphus]|uniref:uncharacterized protein LOC141904570 n=1 Tax=Tubulanus polymorphus TaxID=672921 RepID=UPI003DA1CB22
MAAAESGSTAGKIIELLCSSAKIERDRGVNQLEKYLHDNTTIAAAATVDDRETTVVGEFERVLLTVLSTGRSDPSTTSGNDSASAAGNDSCSTTGNDSCSNWESYHGCLLASNLLILNSRCSDDFIEKFQHHAIRLLEHNESRVRLTAGESLKTLCMKLGTSVYVKHRSTILNGVRNNLERQALKDQEISDKLVEKLASDSEENDLVPKDAAQIFHDTAGWKCLETWMKCLQLVVEGCGQQFNSFIDQDLVDLIFQALEHTNRFVRETGYQVCGAIVNVAAQTEDGKPVLTTGNAVLFHGDQFARMLAVGLADNWSQVRLAASVATRKFLHSMPDEAAKEKFYALLIPRMCLNRYYVAEGVRLYSQETWRQCTAGAGKQLVETHIKHVVDFYISQTEADNHAVREAACACIAELGTKISHDAVKPYVSRLLDALLVCFKDDSWPVRDASCVACGNFILCFPAESKHMMSSLYPLFFENLQDNIPSVRQGAAVALTNVCKAYGHEAITVVIAKVKEGLEGIEKQAPDSEKYSSLEKGPAVYGVVKKARDNDMDLHSNMPMYSCGSLAPKMGRGKRGGGCMDHQFRRPAQPWELADGCVNLVAELSQIQSETQKVALLLPLVAKAANIHNYANHVNFLETICKSLPTVAKGIGKRFFKPNLEAFFDAIFYSLSCDNALTSSSASQCLNQLSSYLGPNILRGRVEQYNPKYLQPLDANQYIAAL